MNKYIKYVWIILLIAFSFYYTDVATTIIKNNDPIMKKIRKNYDLNIVEPVNAEILNNTIKPGVMGYKVDINKTYELMKKYGSYNSDLIVLESISPSLSIGNILDKFVVGGNTLKNEISLVFIINDYSYITEILNILNEKKVITTFFINKDIIDESNDLLKLLYKENQNIELYSSDYKNYDIKKYNKKIAGVTGRKLKYCITLNSNKNILDNCKNNNMYTVLPNIITGNFAYNDVKTNIKNGSIIKLSNTEEVLRELKYILNYINQRGYRIVSLDKLLKE